MTRPAVRSLRSALPGCAASAALAMALLCPGCRQVSLSLLHTPPPDATGAVDQETHDITLSRGIALAIECIDSFGEPCDALEAVSNDETIAFTYRVHLDELMDDVEDQRRTAFIIVGGDIGTTGLDVYTSEADGHYSVEVVP